MLELIEAEESNEKFCVCITLVMYNIRVMTVYTYAGPAAWLLYRTSSQAAFK